MKILFSISVSVRGKDLVGREEEIRKIGERRYYG